MNPAPSSSPLSSRGPRQRAAAIQPKKSTPTVAEAKKAFLAARRTVFGHLIFVGLCCVLAFVLRKLIGLPSIMIGAIFIAAVVVFANDIVRMFISRRQLVRALAREN